MQSDVPPSEKIYGHLIKLCEGDIATKAWETLPEQIPAYHITLVEMADELKQRLKIAYVDDHYWNKVLDLVKEAPQIIPDGASEPPNNVLGRHGLRFVYRQGLIYYISGDGKERLCIPEAIEQDIFQIAYDQTHHGGFHRTYDRIAPSVYIRQLSKRLRTYIAYCPECQLNQTK